MKTKRNPSKNVVRVPLTSIQLLKARVFNPPPTIIFPLLSNLLAGANILFLSSNFPITFPKHYHTFIADEWKTDTKIVMLSHFDNWGLRVRQFDHCSYSLWFGHYPFSTVHCPIFLQCFFSLRRNSCSVECPRACEVSDWTEWSRWDKMTIITNTFILLITQFGFSKVPGHVSEGKGGKGSSVDGDPKEREGASCHPCTWRQGGREATNCHLQYL